MVTLNFPAEVTHRPFGRKMVKGAAARLVPDQHPADAAARRTLLGGRRR
jgi:hypothetical protein